MIILLDTNLLLVSVSSRSTNHWVYKKFLAKEYELVVSTEIFLEYEEILGRFMNHQVAETTRKAIAAAKNTILITKWYHWNLIEADPDENKFVDAYIVSGADYIVTEDRHFDILKTIPFPPVKVIGLDAFKQMLSTK